MNTHLTNQLKYDTDSDGFSDGRELALGTNPLSAASRLPNLARSGLGIIGRIFWASGSSSFLQKHGTPITCQKHHTVRPRLADNNLYQDQQQYVIDDSDATKELCTSVAEC